MKNDDTTLDRRLLLKGALSAGMSIVAGGPLLHSLTWAKNKENEMKTLKYFLDTHDREHKTFPAKITPLEFEGFYAKYEKACQDEGVIPVRLHVGYNDGRAFCLTLAPDVDAVKRAHERVGLPYDTISEVLTATPGDTFFRRQG